MAKRVSPDFRAEVNGLEVSNRKAFLMNLYKQLHVITKEKNENIEIKECKLLIDRTGQCFKNNSRENYIRVLKGCKDGDYELVHTAIQDERTNVEAREGDSSLFKAKDTLIYLEAPFKEQIDDLKEKIKYVTDTLKRTDTDQLTQT